MVVELVPTHKMRIMNYAWWRVDLGRVEPMTEAYVVNRGDSWGWRLGSFEIRVGR